MMRPNPSLLFKNTYLLIIPQATVAVKARYGTRWYAVPWWPQTEGFPSEERVEVSEELKRSKSEGKINWWRADVWAVQLGWRGFPACSTVSLLKLLCLKGKKRKGILKVLSETAEEARRSIWRWSHQKSRHANQNFMIGYNRRLMTHNVQQLLKTKRGKSTWAPAEGW